MRLLLCRHFVVCGRQLLLCVQKMLLAGGKLAEEQVVGLELLVKCVQRVEDGEFRVEGVDDVRDGL